MIGNLPIVRTQIASLREMSQAASQKGNDTNESSPIGHILTSNMLAGFALELGLKLFYWTYGREKSLSTHNLSKLFLGLPQQIQADICLTYETSCPIPLPIKTFAFIRSASPPAVPNRTALKKYDTARNVINSVSHVFIEARYFFEQVTNEDWQIVDHPIQQMGWLSGALAAVYEEYERRGGWGDANFSQIMTSQ